MQPTSGGFESRLSTAAFSIGVLLFVLGTVGFTLDLWSMIPVSGPGLQLDFDLGLLGVATGVGAVLGDRMHRPRFTASPTSTGRHPIEECPPVYVTRPLLDVLLRAAEASEPESLSVGLAVTLAGSLSGTEDLPETMPVFTHVYYPERPNSVSSVFGVDLQTPPGRTHGRFVTHPRSGLRLTKRDDLHGIVLVAVPPWDESSVAAFDRRGRRCPLRVIDAVPPDETLSTVNQ